MIQVTTTYKCRVCGSENIIKNGRNKAGNAQYHCKDCGAYRVLEPKPDDKPERRRQVLQAYRERASLRGLRRIFGITASSASMAASSSAARAATVGAAESSTAWVSATIISRPLR